MSELGALERTLGSMHWPQDILRYLFLVAPTPYTLLELTAFFFGNGIELPQATAFLLECFSTSQDHRPFSLCTFQIRVVGTMSQPVAFIRILRHV